MARRYKGRETRRGGKRTHQPSHFDAAKRTNRYEGREREINRKIAHV